MKNRGIVLLIVIGFSAVSVYGRMMKTNLAIVSAGSWMVFPKDMDRFSFFNKFSTTVYSSGKIARRVVTVPLAWTVYVRPDNPKSRFFPGNFDIYFAHRFGWLEPKIGVEVPMGYGLAENWKKEAWIGTNNLRVQAGFSISRSEFEQIGLPFGIDASVAVAVTDNNAWYKIGSTSMQIYIKSSRSITKKITIGGELAVYGKWATWVYNNSKDNGLTFLPTISANYRFTRRIYGGIKTGFGPSLKPVENKIIRRSNALDAGISVLYFP